MNTAVINIKTDPTIKKQAQKKAENLGLSLSSVINKYLRDFIHARTVEFSDVRLDLTPWAKRLLKKSEEDYKAGRYQSFTTDEYLAYLDTMIGNEQKSNRRKAKFKV